MAINIQNLNFKFDDGSILYDDCSFLILENKMNVLLGLNGSGKTTLFKILKGEIKADVKILNNFKNIFYMPQTPLIPKGVSAFDYLSSVFFKNSLKWFLPNEEKEKTLSVLDKIGLLNKKNVEVDKLSGGEFQKLNLALSLMTGADLLLLDEPVSSLDIINQKLILDTIKNFKVTSVVILHDLNLAANFGDNFIGINSEKKIIQGEKDVFFTPTNLKNIFHVNFKVIKNEKYFIQIAD